jgi:hypothetical protein
MGFELIIKPVVFLDAEEAVKYYDAQLQGLGKRFYDNLLFSFAKIQTKPFAIWLPTKLFSLLVFHMLKGVTLL